MYQLLRYAIDGLKLLNKIHMSYDLFLRYVLSAVKSGRNVFFTGGAGTGKSFLVQKIIGVILTQLSYILTICNSLFKLLSE